MGLMAYVLMARDHCSPAACPVFRSLTDSRQIAANMDERLYESLVTRYAPSWNAPPQTGAGLVAALPPTMPTGKPTNAEFPTSASTPAVSIMAPEPPAGAAAASRRRGRPRLRLAAAIRASFATGGRGSAGGGTAAAAKKQAAAQTRRPAPVQIAPTAPAAPPQQTNDCFQSPRRALKLPQSCRFISSSLPSAASPSNSSKAGSPNVWRTAKKKGLPLRHIHITRMTPKRDDGTARGRFAVLGDQAAKSPRAKRSLRSNRSATRTGSDAVAS